MKPAYVSPTVIAHVRKRFEANGGDYPRFCTCLRETFAEFTGEPGTEATWELPTSAHAVACFPEYNAHTVADAWNRAVRCWRD